MSFGPAKLQQVARKRSIYYFLITAMLLICSQVYVRAENQEFAGHIDPTKLLRLLPSKLSDLHLTSFSPTSDFKSMIQEWGGASFIVGDFNDDGEEEVVIAGNYGVWREAGKKKLGSVIYEYSAGYDPGEEHGGFILEQET